MKRASTDVCPAFILPPSSVILPAAKRRRRGFSFVEVLFAVMILGIGFIMIAGIFPVAISQAAQTQEETIGAACARGGVAAVSNLPGLLQIVPADGTVIRLTDANWNLIKGNQILPQDPRYAWVPLLKRNTTDFKGQTPSVAQLFIVPVQVRGRSNFDVNDVFQYGSGSSAYSNLMAWPVQVQLTEGFTNPDTLDVSGANAAVAAPGAVVIISSGNDSAGRPASGRIYRLGNRPSDSTPNHYELLRGSDMTLDPGANGRIDNGGDDIVQTTGVVNAWIVGQGMATPGNTASFGNGSMATGVYTTFIELK